MEKLPYLSFDDANDDAQELEAACELSPTT